MNATPRRDDFRFVHRVGTNSEGPTDSAPAEPSMFEDQARVLARVAKGIGGYWRALALPLDESMAALGGSLQAGRVTLDVHGPVSAADVIDVAVRFERREASSVVLHACLFRGDECRASAGLTLDFVDAATRRPLAVPPTLIAILDRFERGAATCDIQAGDWQRLGREAAMLRRAVFVREQGIAEALEWDELDATAVHMVLRNGLGRPVATGRLLVEAPGLGRIGRMAVHRALRGAGHGATVLRALEDLARKRGDGEITLHAQYDARDFYAGLGYRPHGEPFDEAGIVHVEMRRRLAAGVVEP
jgi:predicted GNAT family N-acyltransferase/acyl-CoA thioesterase FadM